MADNQSFFAGLGDAFMTGLQGTRDAFSEDIKDIKRGQFPKQVQRDLQGLLATYQNPSMGSFLPPVPKFKNPHFDVLDRMLEGFSTKYSPEQLAAYKETILNSMGPAELAAVKPTGEFVQTMPAPSQLLGRK